MATDAQHQARQAADAIRARLALQMLAQAHSAVMWALAFGETPPNTSEEHLHAQIALSRPI